jgi:heat shock protein HtpX
MPTVAIAPHDQPNAFATGRNPEHAVVCVTEGIMRLVSKDELEGVIAHELAHIKNHDMLLQTITATMAGAITNVAQFGLFFGGGDDEEGSNPLVAIGLMVIAPIAAMLVQFAISRQREFKADAVGAQISGQPALAGQRAAQAGGGRAPHPDARVALGGAARAGEPARRVRHARHLEAVLDPPAHRGARRAPHGAGRLKRGRG